MFKKSKAYYVVVAITLCTVLTILSRFGLATFYGGSDCEYGCENEWFSEETMDVMKNTQTRLENDHVLSDIVQNFAHVEKGLVKSTSAPQAPRDEGCSFNIADIGSSVPIRATELCRAIPCCKTLAALDPSQKALDAGKEYVKRRLGFSGVLDTGSSGFVPSTGTLDSCDKKAGCFPNHAGQFDLVMSVQMIQHIERSRYAVAFSNLHRLVKPGGRLVTSEIAMIPVFDGPNADLRDVDMWVPAELDYSRMNNCIHGEIFTAWFWLTRRYKFEALHCDQYANQTAPGIMSFRWDQTTQDGPAVLGWYTRRTHSDTARPNEKPTSTKAPNGRLYTPALPPAHAAKLLTCTGILKKLETKDLPADLPPFEDQIREIATQLQTPGWDTGCPESAGDPQQAEALLARTMEGGF
jgi:SAM-dependent methyltransferase